MYNMTLSQYRSTLGRDIKRHLGEVLFSCNVKINAEDIERMKMIRVTECLRAAELWFVYSAFGREIYPEMASISTF